MECGLHESWCIIGPHGETPDDAKIVVLLDFVFISIELFSFESLFSN